MKKNMRLFIVALVTLCLLMSLVSAVGSMGDNTLSSGEDRVLSTQKTEETITGGLADTPWPSFGNGQRNSGRSPYDTSHVDGTRKWNYTTGGGANCSFAIADDGTIYTGSDDNNVYALNPDGTLNWSYQTEGRVMASPAIDDQGMIYVGGGSKLYSLSPDGTLNWTYDTAQTIYSFPVINSNGTVYLGTMEHPAPLVPPEAYLTALYPNGTVRWQKNIGDDVISSPAIGPDGTIYIGSEDYNLYAYHPNGSEKWQFNTGYRVYSSPSVDGDGNIYFGSNDNKIYAVDQNGSERWNYTTDGAIYSSPSIGPDGDIYAGSGDGKLYALNSSDGSEIWNFTTGNGVDSSPAIGADSTIYFGSDDDKLYALNPNGTEKWNYTTGGNVWSSPAIASDGTVYVGSADNNIYAIGWNTTHSCTLSLSAGGESDGWNFVSFNLTPLTDDLTSLLDDPQTGISGNYDKVMYYHAAEDEWRTYIPDRAGRFNDIERWNRSMGIWIHMTADDNLTINGTVPSSTSITLHPGWNMVGYPSNTTGNNGLPSEITKVGYFNASDQYNLAYDYDPSSFSFQAGRGYWLYNGADSSIQWTVNY